MSCFLVLICFVLNGEIEIFSIFVNVSVKKKQRTVFIFHIWLQALTLSSPLSCGTALIFEIVPCCREYCVISH